MDNNKDLQDKIKELAAQKGFDVKKVEFEGGKAKVYLGVQTNAAIQPEIPEGVEIVSSDPVDTPIGAVSSFRRERGGIPSRLTLDTMSRDHLDLYKKSVLQSEPQELYRRSIEYYRSKGIYGTTINVLTNFASKGFENDIDDLTIKNFYDNWVIDTKFDDIVEKIFLDFFRVGFVRTYKVVGKYEPKVNFLSSVPGEKAKKGNELAARKNRYSNSFIPIAYTILNPTEVVIKGSLMFGQAATYLKASAGDELRELLEKDVKSLTTFERKIIDSLPKDVKKAVKDRADIPLDPELTGDIDYRRQPYERYPIPRGARAFDAIDFKDDLQMADSSTLDGITSYILKITVGNDERPVRNQEVLETVSRMFDTVSKSFKIVWDHTLDIEKITSPELGEILGRDKYVEVDRDINAALNIPRALIDGESESSSASLDLAVKSVIEEIHYARRQVQKWIYNEYESVANAMGFDRYPRVRFDDMALRDELAMMSIIQGMIDRRIISYRTGQKKLGFDPDTELSQLQEEKPFVLDGDLGIIGSPYQKSAGDGGVQPTQRAPTGTPSEGRPKGRPAKSPASPDKTKPPASKKEQLIDNTASASLTSHMRKIGVRGLEELSLDELHELVEKTKREKVLAALKNKNKDDE